MLRLDDVPWARNLTATDGSRATGIMANAIELPDDGSTRHAVWFTVVARAPDDTCYPITVGRATRP